MDKHELDSYQVQLQQVTSALAVDPSNAELISLKDELQELIDMTSAAIKMQQKSHTAQAAASSLTTNPAATTASHSAPTTAAASSSSVPAVIDYKVGDEVQAKYTDGQFYPGRITTISGPISAKVYTILFPPPYNSTLTLPYSSLKVLSVEKKRKLEEEKGKAKKKAKNEKWKETLESKKKEQEQKQSGWKKFETKAKKKGLEGVKDKSMFATSELPGGRVGVVNSGRGTTDYLPKQKHKFTPSGDSGRD